MEELLVEKTTPPFDCKFLKSKNNGLSKFTVRVETLNVPESVVAVLLIAEK